MSKRIQLRCMARRQGDLWEAVCLDFSLAAQGSTFEEARDKLGLQINEYVEEALTVDREHRKQLLSRKAPLSLRAIYQLVHLRSQVKKLLSFLFKNGNSGDSNKEFTHHAMC